jgi:hypothetical protein
LAGKYEQTDFFCIDRTGPAAKKQKAKNQRIELVVQHKNNVAAAKKKPNKKTPTMVPNSTGMAGGIFFGGYCVDLLFGYLVAKRAFVGQPIRSIECETLLFIIATGQIRDTCWQQDRGNQVHCARESIQGFASLDAIDDAIDQRLFPGLRR